jgi:hypothetical protein
MGQGMIEISKLSISPFLGGPLWTLLTLNLKHYEIVFPRFFEIEICILTFTSCVA